MDVYTACLYRISAMMRTPQGAPHSGRFNSDYLAPADKRDIEENI
jgi:hypothetical protein